MNKKNEFSKQNLFKRTYGHLSVGTKRKPFL